MFRPKLPSPAMAVALLALFVALGGSGYAAVQLQKNSVGTKQLKRGAVKNADIAANAVTGSKVRARSLTAGDFRAGSLPQGPRGPEGPRGAAGNPASSAVLGRGISVPAGPSFLTPSGLADDNANENLVSSFTPNTTIVASDLSVSLSVAPGLTDSRTFTLRVGNADTPVVCVVAPGTSTCNSTGSATIPPASLISIGSTSTGTPLATDVRFGWRAAG
jgi:hypothetical protein